MTWLEKSVQVTPVASSKLNGDFTAAKGFFAYSSIAELNDAAVAILYEDNQFGWGAGSGYGYTMDFKTFSESELEAAFGVTFDSNVVDDSLSDEDSDVEIIVSGTDTKDWVLAVTPNQSVGTLSVGSYVAYDVTITKADGTSYTGSAQVTLPLGALAGKNGVYPFVITDGAVEKIEEFTIEEDQITFTAPHFSVMGVVREVTTVNTVNVTVQVGQTHTETIDGANYQDSYTGEGLNEAIATVVVNGIAGTTETTVSTTKATTVEAGATYIICVSDTTYALTSNKGGTTWGDSDGDTRKYEPYTGPEADNMWTLEASGSGYKLKSAAGYLNLGKNAAWVDNAGEVFTLSYSASGWTISDGTYNIDALGGLTSYYCAGGWPNSGTRFDLYMVTTATAASTTVTITGNAVGNTAVDVGDTRYIITVIRDFDKEINVELHVGDTSETYTDTTGNYQDDPSNVAPDASIATMAIKGVAATTAEITAVTALTENDSFYIQVSEGVYLKKDCSTTTILDEAETWYVSPAYSSYQVIRNSDNQRLAIDDSGNLYLYSSGDWNHYLLVLKDGFISRYNNTAIVTTAQPVKVTGSVQASSTEITFTGKGVGSTVAYVGKTKYNITVSPAGVDAVVDIELEVGEFFTYTDTTGNYVNNVIQQPDGTYATMEVVGSVDAATKKLVSITAATFTQDKRYVLENVRASGSQGDHSVLTSTEENGGLGMNGPLNLESSQIWTLIPDDNYYLLFRNGEYVTCSNNSASMETAATQLMFQYVDGGGWLIYVDNDRSNSANDGDSFLSDYGGDGATTTKGYNTLNDSGNYWNVYEVVEEVTTNSTDVIFTGKSVGETVAIVGDTQYNITVVAAEADDEVMNSATNTWTVDPEIQRDRYNGLIGLHKDLYSDDSWHIYETARLEAYKKLIEITHTKYTSAADAQAVLDELTTLVDALVIAKNQLVSTKIISVRYLLDGAELDIREYKIPSTDTTLSLPASIVVDNIAYKVSVAELDLTGETGTGDTVYEVSVTVIGKLGGGFVGSSDINLGNDHNGHPQVCDLVDNNNIAKKITEMTLTVGMSYNLDLATDTTGYTVEWTSEVESVATVDQNGNVAAVAAGTTHITGTIKDAGGNIVEANTIPVTVFTKGTADRKTAIYIEDILNTTVWCVVNGDTQNRSFEVIEGELIYGQFDTKVQNNTHTTAFSFFGDPDEAHALVYMKSTNSDDHYFLLHDDDGNLYDGTVIPNGNYYVSGTTGGAGYWQAMGLNNNSQPGWKLIKDMVQWAISKGCDGGLGFTRRQSEGALASNLQFASDPMPRIEKVVDGVLPASRKQTDYRKYTEGMVAAVGELVYFKITVAQEVPTVWKDLAETIDAIEYIDAWVQDTILPGAYLYTQELDQADGTWDGNIVESKRTQMDNITQKLNAAWTEAQKAEGGRTFEYYLVYEIQKSDISEHYIENIAHLEYKYISQYSKGAQAGVADADAKISIDGVVSIDDVVIDFGQTVAYTGLENAHLRGAYVDGVNDVAGITSSKATAKYGDVKVTRTQQKDENTGELLFDRTGYPMYDYTVTYTPTMILQGIDTVEIYGLDDGGHETIINSFRVYPATTVYYEEGFLFASDNYTGDWNLENSEMATTTQAFELLGKSVYDAYGVWTGYVSDKKHAYGYDPLHAADATGSANSYVSSEKAGASTSFTFTGTGFEVYANCTEKSGFIATLNQGGEIKKMYIVNTVVAPGETEATTGQVGNFYNIPIVSQKDLPHGTYTITLRHYIGEDTVYVDGFRVTNTLADTSVFEIDKEDNPEFYQIRDYVLHAITPKDADGNEIGVSQRYGKLSEMTGQVYKQISNDGEAPADAAVIFADNNPISSDEWQDILDKGPKNELYLYPGQTLTFKVTTQRMMQLGMKAPIGATNYSLSYYVVGDPNTVKTLADGVTMKTSVDMFYEVVKSASTTPQEYVVTVANTGTSGILALTDVKICDDPNAAFTALTEADVRNVLKSMGYTDPAPEAPEAAVTVLANGKPRVTWNAVDGAVKYNVYLATSADGEYKHTATMVGTGVTHNSAKVGETYFYKICAVNADGTVSEDSNVVSATCELGKPQLKASNVASTGKPKVTWKAVDGAVKYKVYLATSADGEYKNTTTVTGTKVNHTSAKVGVTYYYKIEAIGADGAVMSDSVARTCDLPAPEVTVTVRTSTGKPRISWNAVEGAVKYKVYVATSVDGEYKCTATRYSTNVVHNSAEAGVTYFYKVRAIHSESSANSAYSSVQSFKVK